MLSNRARDTAPEVALRAELHRSGLRFFKNRRAVPDLKCQPDVLFPRLRIAVFLDGCYWHGCPDHGSWPKSNAVWWRTKIEENQERDRRHSEALRAAGWLVIRIWEHERLNEAAATVVQAVELRRMTQDTQSRSRSDGRISEARPR